MWISHAGGYPLVCQRGGAQQDQGLPSWHDDFASLLFLPLLPVLSLRVVCACWLTGQGPCLWPGRPWVVGFGDVLVGWAVVELGLAVGVASCLAPLSRGGLGAGPVGQLCGGRPPLHLVFVTPWRGTARCAFCVPSFVFCGYTLWPLRVRCPNSAWGVDPWGSPPLGEPGQAWSRLGKQKTNVGVI